MPTVKAKNIKGVSFEIVGFELAVLGEPDMELESSLPPELRGLPHLEPYTVTEEEFMELFSIHNFTDLQSPDYFGKSVTEKK